MKFLCVCQDGNVRSAGLAYLLHNKHGQEAVPVGWRRLSHESLSVFCAWADYVVVMRAEYQANIPPAFHSKVRVAEVGPDRFGNPFKSSLRELLDPIVAAWAAKGFVL
jgi:hypothetical protein